MKRGATSRAVESADTSARAGAAGFAPRSGGFSTALALSSASAWLVMRGVSGWPRPLMAILLAGAALVSKRRVTRETAVLALATAALATFSVLPFGIMWIWALLAVTAAVLVAEHFRAPWWTRGELTRGIAWWIASSIAVSGGALVVWWLAFRPALSELTFPGWVQRLPPVGVAAVFVAWASLNALAEESYFRGMMQHALTASLGRAGVVVQAIAFGVFHLQGFPNGATGVALATIFGLMVGALRERARGLLAPWIAHVAADIVIVTIIAMTRR